MIIYRFRSAGGCTTSPYRRPWPEPTLISVASSDEDVDPSKNRTGLETRWRARSSEKRSDRDTLTIGQLVRDTSKYHFNFVGGDATRSRNGIKGSANSVPFERRTPRAISPTVPGIDRRPGESKENPRHDPCAAYNRYRRGYDGK